MDGFANLMEFAAERAPARLILVAFALRRRRSEDRLDAEFDALQVLLDEQRVGDGFRLYTELEAAQVRGLSDQVNALAEPLSKLTAALVLG